MHEMSDIRPPAAAGMFYESSPAALKKNVGSLLENARIPKIKGKVRALISPHAGYVYSGSTAAHAYKSIGNCRYDCVVIVGPSHREYFDGISIYPGNAYRTPMGNVPVEDAVRSELMESGGAIAMKNEGHRLEHSIEVQLPFLQSVLGEFPVVPIIMGVQRKRYCIELSEALVRIGTNHDVLYVASSDLSHYHPYEEALSIDKEVIGDIESYEPDSFIDRMEADSFEACGVGPIAVIMKTAKRLGANKAEILHYCNSGDVTGDKKAVVGYVAAAFIQTD